MGRSSTEPLIIISGVTCSGKDALVRRLRKGKGLKPIVSYTTRQPREGEVNGKDYHFISFDEFSRLAPFMLENDFFAENYYGTLESDYGKNNRVVILTAKVALQVRNVIESKLIFVDCNNDVLYDRLLNSGRNNIDDRLDQAEKERELKHLFDINVNTAELSKEETYNQVIKEIYGIN